MARTLAAVAHEVGGRLVGPDAAFGAVGTDSRKLPLGALFVAIHGERFDGNDYVADARTHGAVGALVSRLSDEPLAQVKVADTRRAFGAMARAWKDNFGIPVVAVTGSNGKTTVKELITSILSVGRRVCSSQGSFNNDIGVPLTLMTLGVEHDALVVELGANHPGEIAYLSELAQPTVGVITNANPSHLEGFGSVAGVAAAKGELLDQLPRAGTAVLNADDPYCGEWRARSRAETVFSFGLGARADCTVVGAIAAEPAGSRFVMRVPGSAKLDVSLPLAGRHNVVNALAAATAAAAIGAPEGDIVEGLRSAHAVRGRLNILAGPQGSVVVDDSYNANPASTRAALDYLAELPGLRILVLGDMAELGTRRLELHREIGEYARGRCDRLLTLGELSRAAASAFGEGGSACEDIASLSSALQPLLDDGTTVLVKGSRVMALDRLVRSLVEAAGPARGAAC
jgi:UDP-N-acetylmuramoyl-tripeptide--D-alanyl-D-alanine ligase